MHTVSVKVEGNNLLHYHDQRHMQFYIRVQVGRVLQLPLAKQVTVADPDRMYPLLQR